MIKVNYDKMCQPRSIKDVAKMYGVSEVSIWILIMNDQVAVSHFNGETKVSVPDVGNWLTSNPDVHERLMKPIGATKNALLEIYA